MRDRFRIAILVSFAIASSALVSCGLVRPHSGAVAKVSADPGGVVRVPLARSVGAIRTYASARTSIPLDPEISAAHVYVVGPGHTHWSLVESTGPHGGPVLDTAEEGVYRVLVSDVQTHGLLPGVGDLEGLRLHVDRRAPKLQLAAIREGDRFSVEYRIDDELELVEPASLLISDDDGRSWRKVYQTLGKSGRLGWQFDRQQAAHVQFSLSATDLAGNGATFQRRFDELASTLSIVDSASPDSELPHAQITPSEYREQDRTQGEDSPEGHAAHLEAAPAIAPRALWRPIHDLGLCLSGGSILRFEEDWEYACVESPDGSRHVLERVGEDSIRLPELDGDDHHLVLRIGGREYRSVAVRFDSAPPELTLIAAEPRRGGLLLRYRVRDSRMAEIRVSLNYRRETGTWRRSVLPPSVSSDQAMEHLVELPEGHYSFYLSARDFGGRTVELPSRESALSVRIVSAGPRIAVAKGQCYRGGDRHTLYFERIDPESVHGLVRVGAVGHDDATQTLEIGEIQPMTSSRSWRVPRVDGEYRFHLSWHDARGRSCEWTGEVPFRIDSSPPTVAWSDLAASPERFAAVITTSETLESVELLRRPWLESAEGEWQPIEDAPVIAATGENEIEVTLVTSKWVEGRWQLGVRGRDAAGNRLPEPAASPSFLIDRTPPEISTVVIPSVMVEGVPWILEGQYEGLPDAIELVWTPHGLPTLQSRVQRQRKGDRAQFEISLPPGRGALRLIALDESGNRSERSATVQVLEAIEEIDVFPRYAVWSGLDARLRYEVRAPHPRAGESLEMRVVRLDGSVQRRYSLRERSGQIQFAVPAEPGEYEVVIAIAGRDDAFRRGHRFKVQEQPTATNSETRRRQELNDFIVEFRQYVRRWSDRERGAEIDAVREELIADLQRCVEREPRLVAQRRAWAALYIYRLAPDLDRSRKILRDGLEATEKSKLPLIYDDLSAVEAMAGDYREAERLLVAAISVSDTSKRRANLGRVFVNSGNSIRAIAEYRRAMDLAPENPGFRREWIGAIRRLRSPLRERELRAAIEQIGRWEGEGRISQRESIALERLATETTNREEPVHGG